MWVVDGIDSSSPRRLRVSSPLFPARRFIHPPHAVFNTRACELNLYSYIQNRTKNWQFNSEFDRSDSDMDRLGTCQMDNGSVRAMMFCFPAATRWRYSAALCCCRLLWRPLLLHCCCNFIFALLPLLSRILYQNSYANFSASQFKLALLRAVAAVDKAASAAAARAHSSITARSSNQQCILSVLVAG